MQTIEPIKNNTEEMSDTIKKLEGIILKMAEKQGIKDL